MTLSKKIKKLNHWWSFFIMIQITCEQFFFPLFVSSLNLLWSYLSHIRIHMKQEQNFKTIKINKSCVSYKVCPFQKKTIRYEWFKCHVVLTTSIQGKPIENLPACIIFMLNNSKLFWILFYISFWAYKLFAAFIFLRDVSLLI